MTEDEKVRQHHQLKEYKQTPGDSEGQGSLACRGWQGVRHDLMTEQSQQC